jgi:teichuronic acid biosynthesis glycosyltransferase TuaC
VIAPVALLDYANPDNRILASVSIPRFRRDGDVDVFHPRWLYPPYGGWTNAFFLAGRLLWPVARFHRRHPALLIDAHYAHPEGIAAALVSAVLKVPFIVTMRGSELRYRNQPRKRYWMGWALRRANHVVAVSEGLRELAIELGVDPERATVIPNGINTEIFHPRDRERGRARYGIARDEHVILTAGDLAELKGHHRVIHAVSVLGGEGRAVRHFIVGGTGRSGRFAAVLRDQVDREGLHDRVRFLGGIPQDHLAELMSAVDVFCLASSTEGWPNVVNEALACGTPVVATDVGAVRQMITSPEYGIIVPPADAEALTNGLRAALDRAWDRNAIAVRGGSRSWAHVADEVLAVCRSVVG